MVYGGDETEFSNSGSVTHGQLRRGPGSFAVNRSFRYDLFFYRHRDAVERRLRAFAPDIVPITGPGEAGMLGLVLAKSLGVPICASWHTNIHEYGGLRLEKVMPFLAGSLRYGLPKAVPCRRSAGSIK